MNAPILAGRHFGSRFAAYHTRVKARSISVMRHCCIVDDRQTNHRSPSLQKCFRAQRVPLREHCVAPNLHVWRWRLPWLWQSDHDILCCYQAHSISATLSSSERDRLPG